MVHIAIPRGVEGFPIGKVAATHFPLLLQAAQVAINGGKPHAASLAPDAAMKSLATQFFFAATQRSQN
jgi:hypothetical protein